MKLSLLGTAGCLDCAVAGGPWRLVGTALSRPNAFVKRLMNKNSMRFGGSRRVGDIFVLDCRSGCSRSL